MSTTTYRPLRYLLCTITISAIPYTLLPAVRDARITSHFSHRSGMHRMTIAFLLVQLPQEVSPSRRCICTSKCTRIYICQVVVLSTLTISRYITIDFSPLVLNICTTFITILSTTARKLLSTLPFRLTLTVRPSPSDTNVGILCPELLLELPIGLPFVFAVTVALPRAVQVHLEGLSLFRPRLNDSTTNVTSR